jgi:hypothetical protein
MKVRDKLDKLVSFIGWLAQFEGSCVSGRAQVNLTWLLG